ncbi:Putative prophage phiRv2 integrase [Paraconexibacter sp. AEG42_29]|uniref:Prophage phiRv2 integrase n=1 Tax=Paraconexibacter sp. AEG42_29 TaxID=2997339 RepID=A0AAU7AWF9_9ACTN
MKAKNIVGHVVVNERGSGRAYVANYMTASGKSTRKVLGQAWVKDSGRRTPRGAVIWRAAHGPCPEGYVTPKSAQALLNELLAQERSRPQASVINHDRTLQDAVDAWLQHRTHERRLKPSTLASYKNDAERYMLKPLGAKTPLRRVTQERLEKLQSELLMRDLSPRTVQKAMVLLHGVLELAKRRGWIPVNPCANLERVKVKRRRDLLVLDPDQVFAVATAAATSQTAVDKDRRELYAALIVFSAFSGLRIGEARALRWEDIDFAGSRIQVRRSLAAGTQQETAPKSGLARMVPLIPHAAKALDDLSRRPLLVGATDRVFPTETGDALPEGAARIALYDALAGAGLGHFRERQIPFRWHDLRHTFGTLAAEAFAIRDVMAYMGHEDISTTLIYLHHVPQNDAADRLGALIDRKRAPLGVAGTERIGHDGV